ncbi:MAG: DUF3108 domain-containing protein [Bdellovibrionales bacterium]|nr:DUF3108 domain-containing protein [Bdellovibrionales bacterium]
MKRFLTYLTLLFVLIACASRKVYQYEKIEQFQMNKEYEQMVKVEKAPEPTLPEKPTEIDKKNVSKDVKKLKVEPQKSVEKEKIAKKKDKKVTQPKKRQPSIEDTEGFVGRRPIVDPFQPGEVVEMAVTYFNMAAGYLKFKVNPFVTVNKRKSYDFQVEVKSSKVFSYFYAVDDKAQTFVDYEDLIPSSYTIDVKETKQLKDIRSFFDFNNKKAVYWEKKVKKGEEEQNKKKEWQIAEYSQNVVSAIYYLRTFQLKPGKSLAFRVADAGKNLVFTGEVLRKEKLQTELGEFNTVVVKPKLEMDGVFKQMGDIFIWLTDDERKFPVRIDAKIKIGTLVLKLKTLKK